jgi:hypothetical protein
MKLCTDGWRDRLTDPHIRLYVSMNGTNLCQNLHNNGHVKASALNKDDCVIAKHKLKNVPPVEENVRFQFIIEAPDVVSKSSGPSIIDRLDFAL